MRRSEDRMSDGEQEMRRFWRRLIVYRGHVNLWLTKNLRPLFVRYLISRLRMILAVVFTVTSLTGLRDVFDYDTEQSTGSGADILLESKAEPSPEAERGERANQKIERDISEGFSNTTGFIALRVREGSQDIEVTMKVDEWRAIGTELESIEFHFPGQTKDYVTVFHEFDDPAALLDAASSGTPLSRTEPLNAQVCADPFLGTSWVKVHPSDLSRKNGTITFTWVNALQKTGFGKYRLYLQLGTVTRKNLEHVGKFRVRVICPGGYELSSRRASLQQHRFRQGASWDFEGERWKEPLDVVLEQPKANRKDLVLGLLFTLLGLGIALAVEELIGFLRPRSARLS